jgi:hypothetical protein
MHDQLTLVAQINSFQRLRGLTETQQRDIANTTFNQVLDVVRHIQTEQERQGSLMYMKRLEPFLLSMQQFSKTVDSSAVFADLSAMAYVWVSAGP